jgi:hypothetical protein
MNGGEEELVSVIGRKARRKESKGRNQRIITVRNEAQGKKARTIAYITSTAFGERKNGSMPLGYSAQIALRWERCEIYT